MTNHYFSPFHDNTINLGTAGGQTKGSSGYTFSNIQKHSRAIVEALINTGKPFTRQTPARFRFYDSVLLNILSNNKLPGEIIFSELFKNNDAGMVLKFLDNETSLVQDLQIISTLPISAFTRAAINQVF